MGTQIGQYQLERELGHGGFGVVYVGLDLRLGRRAAIKQLLPALSDNREIVERFFNEAKSAASINHPGIVEIYDVGWHTDGSAYFAMKLLDGDSLGKRLRERGPLPVQLAATIARQVASALAAAHGRGIVHRDLKPDNVILVPDDEVAIGERATILDFGIAKLFGDAPGAGKTRSGMMMGTPLYMSPEQCRGAGEVDHRTDIYALGCILFELLAGRPPFVGEGMGELVGKHQFVEPPALRSLRADVPPDLEALVMRTLAKDPAARPQQMQELAAALQPFAAGGRPSREVPVADTASVTTPRSPAPDAISAAAAAAARVQPGVASTLASARGEVAPPPAPPRRTLVLALGALVVVGGGIAIAAVAAGGSSDAPVAAAPPDAAPAPDASVAVAPPPDAAEGSVAERCNALVVARTWDDVEACAIELKKLDPEAGRWFLALAVKEDKARATFAELQAALGAQELGRARALAGTIDTTSVYAADATAAIAAAETSAVDALVAELKPLATDCKRYEARLAKSTDKLVSAKARAKLPCRAAASPPQVGIYACTPGTADPPRGCKCPAGYHTFIHADGTANCRKAGSTTTTPVVPAVARVERFDCSPGAPKPDGTGCNCTAGYTARVADRVASCEKAACNFEAARDAGEQALAAGQYGLALKRYDEALACRADDDVLKKAFLAACGIRNEARAKTLYRKLVGSARMLKQRCIQNGMAPELFD